MFRLVKIRRFAAPFPVVLVCFTALTKDAAPPSPDKPWSPPGLGDYESQLAHHDFGPKSSADSVQIDPEKIYGLPELIDIAERSNPETRVAWEQARQAAAAVGLAQSTYYPYLAASAGVGYDHAFIPFPTLQAPNGLSDVSITGGGTLVTDALAERATLGVKWLLLDFGERKAATTAASERLMMADVIFNATHQKIVFEVTRRFYEFNTARQKVVVAESSLSAVQTVGKAVTARSDHGLATKPELLQAEQQVAQSEFELEVARDALSDSQVALVESLGILPTTKLQVAEVSGQPFPENSAATLDEIIDRALSQRPDLVARLASLRAAQAEVRKVRADYYPKVTLDAHVEALQLDVSIKDSSYFGGGEPVYGVGLGVEFPIFEGFARKNKMRIAEAEVRAAEHELAGSRDAVIREVWKAYNDFEAALHKQESAAKLVSAAESAYNATLQAYQNGLSTYVDVANAQRNVTAGRSVVVDTRAAIFTSAAALALSQGELARPANSTATPSKK
jgi:outer membrane protein